MKNNNDLFDDIADKIVAERSEQLEKYFSDEQRQTLDENIEAILFKGRLKKRRLSTKLVAIIVTILMIVTFVGGVTLKAFEYYLIHNDKYNTVVPLIPANHFKNIIKPPNGYEISELHKSNDISRVTFVNGDEMVIFVESKTDLSLHTDNEDIEYLKKITLFNGYEGYYMEKDGATIYFEYDHLFYKVYVSDSDNIDILRVVSTLGGQ